MTDLMRQFHEVVSDARGAFHARVMARECADGGWEAWLEFLPADRRGSAVHATSIETHQHDRVTVQRWASGLTRVYVEGALGRARTDGAADSDLLVALQEIIDALDRRLPQVERAGEAQIAADAERLRARAIERMALLGRRVAEAVT